MKPTKLTCVEDLFILECDYQNRHIASAAGFSWSKQAKKWFTDSPEAALMLKEYAADNEVAMKLAQVEATVNAAISASRATSSNAKIPAPEGKNYLPFQKAGIEYMTNRNNVLLGDEMGCLSGDSIVPINRAGKGFKVKLKDAYLRFNSLDKRYSWNTDIPTFATSLINGELRLNQVKAIKFSGIKSVVKVTTEKGKSLTLTTDHEVLLENGTWTETKDLEVGSKILVNGQYVCRLCGSPNDLISYEYSKFKGFCRSCAYKYLRKNNKRKEGRFEDADGYIRVSGLSKHPRCKKNGYVYEHILTMESYLGRLVDPKTEHVHHKNGIKNDNRIENLELLKHAEHNRAHRKHRNFGTFVPVTERVVEIVAAGETETYDIVMDDPGRNFVANGIIVHNCGKTIEAVGLINNIKEARDILVVCPASLRINWRKELSDWLVKPLSIGMADTKKEFPDENVVIINYDILNRFEKELRSRTWDILFVDECHYLKNPKTRRTQQVIGRKKHRSPGTWELEPIPAKRRIFMSGTPLVNRPIELWPLISTLDPKTWSNFGGFSHRYCNAHRGRFGWDMSGAANLGELQRKLRESILLRRTKDEVLTELPPKIRQVVVLPMNGARGVVEKENRAFAAHEAALYELRVAAELAKAESHDDYVEAVQRLREGASIAFGELAVARKETAIAKVPYVIEHLQNAGDNKVVIFAHHREVIRLLHESLGDAAVVLTGETSMKKRNDAVKAFQEDPEIKYFIGSIQAAGVGLTLTASSHVVFAELDWVPGIVNQAEDRCHRISQRNSVLVQHLVFDGSVDSKMAKTLVSKQSVFDAAMNDPDAQIPAIPEDDPPATHKTSWKQVDSESKIMKPQTVAAIHSALRYLANICDGARQEDAMGFNAYDTDIGKSLAAQSTLSDKQAVLGRKILMKYKRQLGQELMDAITD